MKKIKEDENAKTDNIDSSSELFSSNKLDNEEAKVDIKFAKEILDSQNKKNENIEDVLKSKKQEFFMSCLEKFEKWELWSNLEEWMLIQLYIKYDSNFKLITKAFYNRKQKEIRKYFFALLRWTAYEWKLELNKDQIQSNTDFGENDNLFVENPQTMSEEDCLRFITPCKSSLKYNSNLDYEKIYKQTKIEPEFPSLNSSISIESLQKRKLMRLYSKNFEIWTIPQSNFSIAEINTPLSIDVKKLNPNKPNFI